MPFVDGLHELIFPSRCLGCGTPDLELCSNCSKDLQLRDFRSQVAAVPVFSSIRYGPKVARILLAAKEDGVKKADDILLAALQHSLRMAIRTCGIRPVLIPVPHSKRAVRKRGRDFVAEITNRLSLAEGLPARPVIRHNRKVDDQSQLNAPSRFGNLSGAMSVERHCGRASEVFLVDDLMTTGATLGEAVRSLEKAGFHVAAAVTALVALPLR